MYFVADKLAAAVHDTPLFELYENHGMLVPENPIHTIWPAGLAARQRVVKLVAVEFRVVGVVHVVPLSELYEYTG